ncbi:hypothetical protein C8J56DRAFT_920075 [Mycena floridula]|nr:hypothetical protein C8J56DRAFT_920075 [Mycena floridula]
MSSREPMWYCHECNAEMRPLMQPDPICASCHGSFVEKMENPEDDPREFHHEHLGAPTGMPTGIEPFLMSLQALLDTRHPERGAPEPAFTFQMQGGSGGRTITIGGSPTLRSRTSTRTSPTMSEYLRNSDNNPNNGEGRITAPLMTQYLMALLGRDPAFGPAGMGDAAGRGRMGDYVFNQEALDQIITQIMANDNSNRPVPATEEIVDNLPREVLEAGSAMLEKDCAVCKEQFQIGTEDPDEQVVVTLPCKHPFHEPCILPWLKSSGTCPVCRHALIPQPEHHPQSPGSPSGGGSSAHPAPAPRSPRNGSENMLQTLFGYVSGGASSNSSGESGANTSQRPRNRTRRSSSHPNIPGHWDDLD